MMDFNIIDPKIIKVKNRNDGKGYLVHIAFYENEKKTSGSLRILMATRIIYNSEKKMVPYEFAKWEPEHEEISTFKEDFYNWKEMLAFTDKMANSNESIRKAIQKDEMEEFFLEEYKKFYYYDEVI
ncbi:hypothetical protein ACWZQY_023995 [Priestia megaterium]